MRHISLFLAILLTLTGLLQGHALSATAFPENETQPLTKTTLWVEYAGRNDSRTDADPVPVTDATACQTVDARVAADASLLSATAYRRPDLQPSTAGNSARAPPPFA